MLLLACRWTAEALQKYMKSTRSEAPYLPSNIEYIANNNALAGKEDVSSCCLASSQTITLLPRLSHRQAVMSATHTASCVLLTASDVAVLCLCCMCFVLLQVRRIVFEASYLVLGLGDVYLGAPCAVPVNPMHRVVTTKMNPARTFTHEGTVGEWQVPA